jgi:hypothetical protein
MVIFEKHMPPVSAAARRKQSDKEGRRKAGVVVAEKATDRSH